MMTHWKALNSFSEIRSNSFIHFIREQINLPPRTSCTSVPEKSLRAHAFSCLTVKGASTVLECTPIIQCNSQIFFLYLSTNLLSTACRATGPTSSQIYVRVTHHIKPIRCFRPIELKNQFSPIVNRRVWSQESQTMMVPLLCLTSDYLRAACSHASIISSRTPSLIEETELEMFWDCFHHSVAWLRLWWSCSARVISNIGSIDMMCSFDLQHKQIGTFST